MRSKPEGRIRIGVFGGSFNPVHNGHTHAIRTFIKKLGLDRAIMLPTAKPFYKNTCLTDFEHRYAMCLLAVKDVPSVSVSDLEHRQPGRTYTRDMLRILRREYAHADFYLLMGDDVYQRMLMWRGLEEILETAAIGVLARCAGSPHSDGVLGTLTAKGAHIFILNEAIVSVSSTEVREKAALAAPVDGLVPKDVAGYITAHGLYRQKNL